jgi:hypothetical protein
MIYNNKSRKRLKHEANEKFIKNSFCRKTSREEMALNAKA